LRTFSLFSRQNFATPFLERRRVFLEWGDFNPFGDDKDAAKSQKPVTTPTGFNAQSRFEEKVEGGSDHINKKLDSKTSSSVPPSPKVDGEMDNLRIKSDVIGPRNVPYNTGPKFQFEVQQGKQ